VVSPGPADLVTTTAADPKSVLGTQPFVTNFSVTNLGSETAADAAFDVVLSPGLTFISAAATAGGTCAATHCALGALAPGASATIAVTAAASRTGGAWIRGAASTSSPQSSTADDAAEATMNAVVLRTRAVRH
jgi:hypothetical protein